MLITRRQILKTLGVALLAATADPLAIFAQTVNKKPGYMVCGIKKSACLVDLASLTPSIVPLDFMPHSFIHHPAHPSRFLVIEKWGRGCAEVDFAEQRVTRVLDCSEKYWYFGHGVYSARQKSFFVTRVDLETGLGHLVALDSESYAAGSDYQVTVGGLHECHLLPDGSLLTASSGLQSTGYMQPQTGKRVEKTGLVHVDMDSGEVLGKMLVDDPDQMIGHFNMTPQGTIIAVSSPLPHPQILHGEAYFSPGLHQDLRRMIWPLEESAILIHELLGVMPSADGITVAVTNPDGRHVILFDARRGVFLRVDNIPAQGVMYEKDTDTYLVSQMPQLTRLNARTLETVQEIDLKTIGREAGHSVLIPREAIDI